MSKIMNKEYLYKNYKFNIRVSLNTSTERRINGNNYHKVTISDMGSSNWFQEKEVLSIELLSIIENFEKLANDFVNDKDNRTDDEKLLSSVGFS